MLKQAIRFPFRGPYVWANLGCIALCFLIPIVGALVAQGYLITVEKRLIENIDADAPRFNFSRFSDYLMKGIWPFLAALVLSLFFIPIILAIVGVTFVVSLILHDHKAPMVAVIVLGILVYLTSILFIGPLLQPLILKSSLLGRFEAAFDWRFALDYFKRVGLLSIGMHLLLMLIMFPATILSFCIPYLGLFALMTIAMFVQIHLNTQLYLTYLDRGGTPIPFEPEPPESGFPVIMQTQPPPQ